MYFNFDLKRNSKHYNETSNTLCKLHIQGFRFQISNFQMQKQSWRLIEY